MRVCLAGVLVAFAVSGCGAFGGGEEPAAVTRDQLAIMVVPQAELGPAYATLTLDAESGRTIASEFADDTVDPEDTAASVKRAGWRDGYELSYSDPDANALKRREGLYGVSMGVDRFESGSAARAYILKTVADLERFDGGRVEGIKIESLETFDVDLGDGAWGMEYTISAGAFRAHATEVAFHDGAIVESATIVRADTTTARVEAVRLASLLDRRAEQVLADELHEEPVPLEAAKPHISRARIARMTLAGADLPRGTKVKDQRLDTSEDDHISYVREFDLTGTTLGSSTVLYMQAQTDVYADRRGIMLVKQILSGKDSLEVFEAAFRSETKTGGVRPKNVAGRSLSLGDRRMRGFVVSFTGPRGRFDTVVVFVDRGRALVTLTILGRAGDVDARDVRALAAKARAKLR